MLHSAKRLRSDLDHGIGSDVMKIIADRSQAAQEALECSHMTCVGLMGGRLRNQACSRLS